MCGSLTPQIKERGVCKSSKVGIRMKCSQAPCCMLCFLGCLSWHVFQALMIRNIIINLIFEFFLAKNPTSLFLMDNVISQTIFTSWKFFNYIKYYLFSSKVYPLHSSPKHLRNFENFKLLEPKFVLKIKNMLPFHWPNVFKFICSFSLFLAFLFLFCSLCDANLDSFATTMVSFYLWMFKFGHDTFVHMINCINSQWIPCNAW